MTEYGPARSAARAAVARTATTEPGRLRRCSATVALALLAAAAFAPLVVAGASGLGTALAGVAGNVGSGLLGGVIEKALERSRDGKAGPADTDALRDEIAEGLIAALERGDPAAQDLRAELTDLLVRIGGVEAAIEAAQEDVSSHLRACFSELAGQQDEAIRRLQILDAGQRRQERRLEEMADRLRLLSGLLAEQRPSRPGGGSRPDFRLVTSTMRRTVAEDGWRGGAQILVGEYAYLLHGDFAEEHFSPDGAVVSREARALRIVPIGERRQEFWWLRQAEVRQRRPAAHAALDALSRERDLLSALRGVRGLPGLAQLISDSGTATLALGWPASGLLDGPCETLAALAGPRCAPVDVWSMARLFRGLAGLCVTLASLHEAGVAHRCLTPTGIIVLDSGGLALRDAGLAVRDPRPGEGPAGYQAPEQRSGSGGRPGLLTDSYQLASVAYRLISGHPPHPRRPLPLQAQVPEVPGPASSGIDAALAANPAARPDIRSLAESFGAASAELP